MHIYFPLQLTPSPNNHTLPLRHPCNRVTHHLVHNSFCALLLVDHGCGLAHQERARAVHCLVVNVVSERLEVMFNWDSAFGSERFDLGGAVLFPVLDVRIVADAEGSALGMTSV